MKTKDCLLNRLNETDQLLKKKTKKLLSLSPTKEKTSSLFSLGEQLLCTSKPFEQNKLVCQIMSEIIESQVENFPNNIFWDNDYLFSHLSQVKDPQVTKTTGKKIIQLNLIYGNKKEISYSYLHDFTYGFDWIRWIQKDPQKRQNIRPFDLLFLEQLEHRGKEITELVEVNDKKYPKLLKDTPRNTFSFCRDETSEIKVLRKLAAENNIPLKAWSTEKAQGNLDKNFDHIREQVAKDSFSS
ncbi:MAG: hypothetical protein CMP11_03730 [Zetaproteobacteria bacterium]|nr:hypothetical protein [Pseudobdellovibrionaceae bacterium]|tara:strand:- start:433 stop:1155 length:723 start_codon:yes stop_codon:yes gene_type:complete